MIQSGPNFREAIYQSQITFEEHIVPAQPLKEDITQITWKRKKVCDIWTQQVHRNLFK